MIDAITDFIAYMEASDVRPVEPIAQRLATGALIRFRCEGDGPNRQNGWAILYVDDRPAGAFGNYRLNTGTIKWKSGEARALSPAEREALQREWNEAKAQREAEKRSSERQVSLDAAEIWMCAQPASADHPYAARKQLDVTGIKQRSDYLLVPMFDTEGALWNIQRISPSGEKRFLKGGRVDDLFCIIGDFTALGQRCVIGEGYSTCNAIWQASGDPCVVAFTAKNLIRVARLWKELRPDLGFVIFADDDEATAQREIERGKPYRNVGIEAAEAAALEIGAKVAIPIGKAA